MRPTGEPIADARAGDGPSPDRSARGPRRRPLAWAGVALLGALVAPRSALASAVHAATNPPNADIAGTWTAPDPMDPAGAVVLVVTNEDVAAGSFVGTVRFDGIAPGAPGGTIALSAGTVHGPHFSFKIELAGTVPGTSGYLATWSGSATATALRGVIVATRWNVDGTAVTTTTITALRSGPVVTISGTVELACGPSCRAPGPGPLADVEIAARGTERYEAYTDASGTYAFVVPAGRYVLTPVDAQLVFTPAHRVVEATGATGDENFTACATTGVAPTPAVRVTPGRAMRVGAVTPGCPTAVLASVTGAAHP